MLSFLVGIVLGPPIVALLLVVAIFGNAAIMTGLLLTPHWAHGPETRTDGLAAEEATLTRLALGWQRDGMDGFLSPHLRSCCFFPYA
jgi:hypothetical protein